MVFTVLQEQSYSLIGMAAKGGWLMIVLALLSILAIYIFASKLWAVNKASKVDKNFIKDIRDYILSGKIRSARALCRQNDVPVAKMLEKGIMNIDKPLSEIQSSMENVASLQVARLEKNIPALSSIAGGAPMIGFLGTVMGMIQAFFNMANAGNNVDISLLSNGIYTAMVTTVGGLIVGILAYFANNYLSSRITSMVSEMEATMVYFLDMVHYLRDKGVQQQSEN
ncbi:MAG: MotA/TolQ/ExbB proton channel family protein [Bacteroidales bacterium]|nr:MotA/TolQ/ExbB proton channel family protein [Candidatus Cacconaster equi]